MFALPWTRETVPHAVIELTRDCNLSCKACYRQKVLGVRSIEEVIKDVEIIERHQRVHTISLAGGEPTLHPDLAQIVRRIKARGHCVSLVTNGILLTDSLLSQLRNNGLDIVMIHVDEGQNRTDLAVSGDINQINALRKSIAARVAAHQISVGLCTTLYSESFKNMSSLVDLVVATPFINFLFVTHAVAIPKLVMAFEKKSSAQPPPCCGTTNGMVMEEMRQHLNVDVYAYIPSVSATTDGELPCITYSIPVSYRTVPEIFRMQSGAVDRLLVKLSGVLFGRYLYFTPERKFVSWIQIAFNGAFAGQFVRALSFLFRSIGSPLRMKRLVFENAPRITPEGTVNCCDFCPNSTVRDGEVVPVCLADHKQDLKLK